jgi:hypothetical protein
MGSWNQNWTPLLFSLLILVMRRDIGRGEDSDTGRSNKRLQLEPAIDTDKISSDRRERTISW